MDPEFRNILESFPVTRIKKWKPGDNVEEYKYLVLQRQGQIEVLDYLGLKHE